MINPLSLTSVFINTYFNDQSLASATGFIIKKDGDLYIVTNWHVVSGRSAESGKCLSTSAGVPNTLEFFYIKKLNQIILNGSLLKYLFIRRVGIPFGWSILMDAKLMSFYCQ